MRLWLIICVFPLVLAAQVPVRAPAATDIVEMDPEEACSISGQVVNATTGEGLRNASIHLGTQGLPTAFTTTTDAEGKFALAGLAPGTYALVVQRSGFLRTVYGARG